MDAPLESIGQCQKCGVRAELGDGICLRCWDSQATGIAVSDKEFFLKGAEVLKRLNAGESVRSLSHSIGLPLVTAWRIARRYKRERGNDAT